MSWTKFKDEKPPHELVNVAFYSYDCGWAQDAAWWYEDKQCWMSPDSKKMMHEYTHWQLMPEDPVDPEEEGKFD